MIDQGGTYRGRSTPLTTYEAETIGAGANVGLAWTRVAGEEASVNL